MTASGSSISVNTNSISGLTATQGTPSIGTNFFTATGSNLSNNITVTVPGPNFQISTNTNSSFFTNTFDLTTNASAVPIYVRLTGTNQGTFTTNVSLTSDTNSTNVSVTGTVAPPPTPTLQTAPTNIPGLQCFQGSPSLAPYDSYALSGTAITNSVTVSAPAGLQVSFTNDGTGFASSLVIPAALPGGTFSTNVFVRIASTASLGSFTNFITNSTIGGASNSLVQVSGEVLTAGAAVVTPANGTTLSGFTATRPAPSTNQQISVSGTNLPASITITPPAGWEISATNSNNPTTNSIVLATNPAGVVSATPLFIRMASSPVATNYTNSPLRLVSGTNTNSITLLGTVSNPPPAITLSNATLSAFSTPLGTPSSFQSFFAGGTNLTNDITVTAPANFALSFTNNGSGTNSALTIPRVGDSAALRQVYVQMTGANAGTFSNNIALNSGSAATNVSVTGTVIAPAAVTLTMPASVAQGNPDVGTVSVNTAPTTNVVVRLTSSAPSLLAVPATVTIPAGTNSVQFDFETFGGAPTTTVTTIALASGYAQGSATTQLTADSGAASFTAAGYQQSFSNFVSQATLPVGWSVSAEAGADAYTAWGTTALGAKFSASGTNVFGFQHTGTTGTAQQVLTLRNDTGVMLQTLGINYRGRVARVNETRTPAYTNTTVIGTNTITNTSLAYTTAGANPDNQLRTGTNTNIQIPPGGIFQIVWTSDRGSNSGTSRTIGISAVSLTSPIAAVPTITATPSSIGGFSATAGTAGAPQVSFVSGTNLATNITVTPPTGFEISTNFAGGFGSSPLTLLQTAGAVPQTPVYLRVSSGAAPGVLAGTVNLGSTNGTNIASATIALNAMVFSNTTNAQVLADTTSLSGFSIPSPNDSAPQNFQVSGLNLSTNRMTLAVSGNYAISLDSSTYTNSLTIAPSGGAVSPTLVYVRMTGAQIGPQVGNVAISASGATSQNVSLSGVVDPPLPVVTVNTNSMPTNTPQFTTSQGRPSAFGFFTTSASNMATNVTVAAPTNYEVSLSQTANYGPRVTLTNTAGSLTNNTGSFSNRPVYIRLTGAQLMPVTTNTVTVSTGPTSTNFTVTGQVTGAVAPETILTGTLTNFTAVQGLPSAAQSFQVTGADILGRITVEAPQYFEVSLLQNSGYGPRVQLSAVNYAVPTTAVFLRVADTAPVSDNLSGVVRAFSPAADGTPVFGNDLPAEATVSSNSSPFVVADPKALTGFEALPGGVSSSQFFSAGGTNLNDFLNITAPTGYQVSSNGASNTFVNVLRLTPSTPGAVAQDRGLNYYNGTNRVTPTNGMNRGSGFGPWQIIVSNTPGGGAGIFVGNPTNAGIAGMAPDSFGLFANPANASNNVTARRAFIVPLETNQIFSFQWGNNFDAGSAGSKGMALLDGTNPIFTVNMGGASPAITIRQGTNAVSNMLTNYGTNAINISFERTATNAIAVTIPVGRDGGPGYTNTFVVTNTPTGFEFYARGLQAGPPDVNRDSAQPYFNNLLVTTNGGATGANVGPTNVFVRLTTATNTPFGPLNGNVALTSAGATNKFVSLTGNVYAAPILTAAPTNLGGFITTSGIASASRSFTLIVNNLKSDVTASVGGGFELSLDSAAGFSTNLTIPLDVAGGGGSASFPVYVRLGTTATAGTASSTINLAAAGFAGQNVTASVAVAGTVFNGDGSAQIGQPAPASITNLQTTLGQPSAAQAYLFDAVNLGTNPVVATVSTNYQISLNPTTGFTNAVTNFPVGGTIAGATNYVRILGSTSVPVTTNLVGTVTLAAPGTNASSRTVNLRGVVLPPPGIVVAPTSVTNLSTVQGFQSEPSTVALTASNLQGPVTVTADPPLLVSVGGSTFASTVEVTNTPSGTASAQVNVVISSNNPPIGTFTNAIGLTFASANGTGFPAVTTVHTVVPRPAIVVSTNALTNFRTVVGFASDPPQSFNVNGTNLLTNISLALSNVGLPDKYEVSTNPASGWTNSIVFVPDYSGTNNSGPPVTVAQDSGANYPDNTVVTGTNGGIGFGPWTISIGTTNNGAAGIFVGNPSDAGIGGMAINSFGLYANNPPPNPPNAGNFVNASRSFATSLGVGESFSFQWGNNYDAGSAGSKGLRLTDSGGSNIFNLNMGTNAAITLAQGTNPPVIVQQPSAYGTNVMTFTFTRTASNSFTVSAPAGRDLGAGFTNIFPVTNEVAGFTFYASGLQNDGNPTNRDYAQPYFNNLLVTRPGSGSGGVVSNTTVYVRLRADAPIGPAQQQIDLTSGIYALPQTISLDGIVLPKPVFSITPSAITNLFTVTNTPSAPGTFLVNAINLVTNLVVTAPSSAPAAFEISTDAATGFTNLLSIPPGSGSLVNFPIYVRIGSWPTIEKVSNNLVFSNRFALNEVTNAPVAGDVLEANPGDPRPGFIAPAANGAINAVSAGTNGTFYIGGNFTRLVRTAGSVTVTNNFVRVARLLADGTVDAAFDPVGGPNENVRSVFFSPAQNRLYIGGSFTVVDGVPRRALAALHAADGSVVAGFAPQLQGGVGYVNAIVQQPDGKILVGGDFATVGGMACANIARLLPDGTLDPAFQPPNPNGEVRAIALQPDGRILIGGAFGKIGLSNSPSLARLKIDGSFDPTLAVGAGFDSAVNTLAVLPGGSIVAGGQFTSYQGVEYHNRLARISPTGVLDRSFNWSLQATGGLNSQVTSLLVRPTGEIFTTGYFTQLVTTQPGSILTTTAAGRVTQLEADGSVDLRFNPAAEGANDIVLDSATLSTGDVVIVGSFTIYDGLPLSGIAVLAGYNGLEPVITSPLFYTVNAGEPLNFNFTSTGPAPITFTATNTNSKPLLPAGVTLESAGSLSGYAMQAGTFDMLVTSQPASGLPSAPTPFTLYVVPVPVSYDSWAKAWFGSAWTNPAIAGPSVSAPNPSGLNNFAIYALSGGNPLSEGPGIAPYAAPEFATNGLRYLTYTVNRNPLAVANYNVQYSTNLLTPWLSGTNVLMTLTNTPELLKVRPTVPMSQERQQFLRLQIWGQTNFSK